MGEKHPLSNTPSISMLWPFEAPALLRRARGFVLPPHSAQDAYMMIAAAPNY